MDEDADMPERKKVGPTKINLEQEIDQAPQKKLQAIGTREPTKLPEKKLEEPKPVSKVIKPVGNSKQTGGDDLTINKRHGDLKEQRAYNDNRAKWMHEELKPQQISKVKTLCEGVFGLDMMTQMFCDDFKKHCVIIDKLRVLFQKDCDSVIMVLDILLKWFYIKLTQSANTSLALKATEFLMIVFTYLDE